MSGKTASARAGQDRASLYDEITDKIIALAQLLPVRAGNDLAACVRPVHAALRPHRAQAEQHRILTSELLSLRGTVRVPN